MGSPGAMKPSNATGTAPRRTVESLQRFESRNITFIDPDGGWPIVWERARGVHVWDEQGRKFLDLTAAFGVAAAGHANAHVVRAGRSEERRVGKEGRSR